MPKKKTNNDLPGLPFETLTELRDYVYQSLLHLKEEQAAILLEMDPIEAFAHGVINGTLNGLHLMGYDLDNLGGFKELIKAEAPDISRFD